MFKWPTQYTAQGADCKKYCKIN